MKAPDSFWEPIAATAVAHPIENNLAQLEAFQRLGNHRDVVLQIGVDRDRRIADRCCRLKAGKQSILMLPVARQFQASPLGIGWCGLLATRLGAAGLPSSTSSMRACSASIKHC